MGGPTDRFDLSAASNEIRARRAASLSDRVLVAIRDRIGLPYLNSPSCKKGVSGLAAT